MNNKCPKCGEKLGFFYLKQNCPKCGVNLVYYNLDKRLEEDAENADREWSKVYGIIEKLTPAFIKKKREKKNAAVSSDAAAQEEKDESSV